MVHIRENKKNKIREYILKCEFNDQDCVARLPRSKSIHISSAGPEFKSTLKWTFRDYLAQGSIQPNRLVKAATNCTQFKKKNIGLALFLQIPRRLLLFFMPGIFRKQFIS